MKAQRLDPSRGFSLLTALLWTFLLASAVLLLHLRLSGHLLATHDSERQLYSFVLAENGVEYARTILPHVDVNELLRGPDGRHQGSDFAEWRSPLPYHQAQEEDPTTWIFNRDDGLPSDGKSLLLPGGYAATAKGRFLLRFTNNPEESPDSDQDRIVLVRSLGVVPGFLPDPASPGIRNAVTLVEAKLRQERVFELPSPLTLLGDNGVFQFEGKSFVVNGTDRFGVAVSNFNRDGLLEDFRDALDERQTSRIRGAGLTPSIVDVSRDLRSSPVHGRVFEADFWRAFQDNLPEFADETRNGITYLPDGGTLRGKSYKGVVVALGNLDATGSTVEGLLIHLGGGWLELGRGSRVKGAVWMSSLDNFRGALGTHPLQLRLSGNASIVYNKEAVRLGLGKFPPTQLGWRILFPEMAR